MDTPPAKLAVVVPRVASPEAWAALPPGGTASKARGCVGPTARQETTGRPSGKKTEEGEEDIIVFSLGNEERNRGESLALKEFALSVSNFEDVTN